MSKKKYIQSIIDNFQENAGEMPERLQTLFQQIENKLNAISGEAFENRFNMVVTTTADEQQANPDNVFYLLNEAYSLMEGMANSPGPNQEQLLSAVTQLKGFLEVPERDFP